LKQSYKGKHGRQPLSESDDDENNQTKKILAQQRARREKNRRTEGEMTTSSITKLIDVNLGSADPPERVEPIAPSGIVTVNGSEVQVAATASGSSPPRSSDLQPEAGPGSRIQPQHRPQTPDANPPPSSSPGPSSRSTAQRNMDDDDDNLQVDDGMPAYFRKRRKPTKKSTRR
jgi:hypothetical protein